MLGSYRNGYTAFGLILGISLAFNIVGFLSVGHDWIGLQKARTDTNTYAEQQCARQQAKRGASDPTVFSVEESSRAQPESQQTDRVEEQEPDWCDLAAQQSMADSTFGMEQAAWVAIALTAIGVVLVWRTLYYTRETLKEANATTVATRDMLNADRAWMIFDEVDFSRDVRREKDLLYVMGFRFRVCFKNFGRALAAKVTMKTVTFESAPGEYPTVESIDTSIWDRSYCGYAAPGGDHCGIDFVLSVEKLQKIINEELRFTVYSIIIYDDVLTGQKCISEVTLFIHPKVSIEILCDAETTKRAAFDFPYAPGPISAN